MSGHRTVHECLFCPQTFGSAAEKDDHILEHFAQETCADCNQNLIRIGGNLYTLHNTDTCIKRETKSAEHIESCFIGEKENEQQQQQCLIINTAFSEAIAENQISIKSESDATPYYQPISLNRTIPLEMPPLVPIGSTIQYYEERTLPLESIHLEEVIIKTEPANQQDNLMNTFEKEANRYRCNICGKSFTRSDSLRNHKIRMHSEPGTHSCKICCHIYSNEIELAEHVTVCQLKRDKSNEVRKFKDKNAIYECHLCRKQSPTHSGLLAHFRFSHSNKNKWKCDTCGMAFVSKFMLEKHQQSHMKSQRIFKCNICGRLLKDKRGLKLHVSRHKNKNLFKCLVEGCEKSFVVARDRDKHMQTHTSKALEQANEEQEESDWDWNLEEEQPKDAGSVVTETICENEIKTEPTFELYSDQAQQQHISQNVEMTSTKFVTASLNPRTDDTFIEEVDLGDSNLQQFPNESIALDGKHQRQSKSHHKPAECDICGIILSAKSSLGRHKVLKHSAPGTHFCKHCGKTFVTVDELSKHSPECFIRKNGGPFDCNICRRTLLTRRSFRMHMQSQHNPNDKYKCHLCIAQFAQKTALENHFKKHEKEDQLTCDICGKLYSRSDILKFHKIREHSKPGTLYCTFCCRIFQIESELKVHKAICKSKKKKRDKNNKCIDKNATYECYLCCKQSPTHTALRAHFRFKHSSEAIKFKCTICGKGFSTNSVLEMHTKRHNQPLNDRKFMCTVCGKYLLSGESFRSHMRTHTGEKPFKCTFEGCEKSFRTTPNRDEHMRSHTGEKPFHCQINGCDRRFSYGVDFRRHKYKIHGIFTKKFNCTVCNEIFPENVLLKTHMKKHDIKM